MRPHSLIAIVAVLVVGVAIKWFLFSTTPAVAKPETFDILKMQTEYPNMKDLPALVVDNPV